MVALRMTADLRAAWGSCLSSPGGRSASAGGWPSVSGGRSGGAGSPESFFTAWTFILVAVFILTGNIFIYPAFLPPAKHLSRSRQERQQLVAWQAAIDGAALWAVT